MSKHFTRDLVAEQANIRPAPVVVPEADRSFNLPTGVYGATAALYFGFLVIMAIGFSSPGLVLPLAICSIFLLAFFGIATIFARVDPAARAKILGWSEFRHRGIMTHTGRLPMRDAVLQMLILPVLIVMWGLVAVTIAAIV